MSALKLSFSDIVSMIPNAKPRLDPVELHAHGKSVSEWEQGFNYGWNECQQAMIRRLNELARVVGEAA